MRGKVKEWETSLRYLCNRLMLSNYVNTKFQFLGTIVESFVIALGQHRYFRQLFCYCIQSISNVILLNKQSEW